MFLRLTIKTTLVKRISKSRRRCPSLIGADADGVFSSEDNVVQHVDTQ